MSHTKGPWEYDEQRCAIVSRAEWIVPPCSEDDEDGIPVSVISTYSAMGGDDNRADIALMCAAPDMLAALKGLVRKKSRGPYKDINAALDAIAKAEGR